MVVNRTPVDEARLERYREENAQVVAIHEAAFSRTGITLESLPLLGEGQHAQHDSLALARELISLAKTVSTDIKKLKAAVS